MLKPTEADKELKLGANLTPGPWEQHSISVAKNARLIAEKTNIMDPDKAYVMGLMHDIGRRAGIKGILHIFDGYDYMISIGQEELAHICLTHSFPIKDINTYFGNYDCSPGQKDFLKQFIKNIITMIPLFNYVMLFRCQMVPVLWKNDLWMSH